MKYLKPLIIAASVLFLLSGCANIYKMNKAELTVIPAGDVTANPAKWENIGKDLMDGKEFIFLISKGQTIPLKVSVTAPFGKLNAGKNSIVFNSDVYLQISKTKMRFSPDGESWADIQDLRSLKALFHVEKGTFTLGFSANKDNGPEINIDLSAQ